MRGPTFLALAIIAAFVALHFVKAAGPWHTLAAGTGLVLAVIFFLATSHLPGDSDHA